MQYNPNKPAAKVKTKDAAVKINISARY